jgi:hypothetical protein
MSDKGATRFREETILRSGGSSATPVQPVAVPEPRIGTRCFSTTYRISHNVGVPFERMALDVAGHFQRSDQGNRFLLIAMEYFTKWPEAFAFTNQEASIVAEALVTTFVCRFGIQRELHSDQGRNLNPA